MDSGKALTFIGIGIVGISIIYLLGSKVKVGMVNKPEMVSGEFMPGDCVYLDKYKNKEKMEYEVFESKPKPEVKVAEYRIEGIGKVRYFLRSNDGELIRVPYSFSDIEWIDRNYSKVKCPLGLKDLPLGK